MDKKQED